MPSDNVTELLHVTDDDGDLQLTGLHYSADITYNAFLITVLLLIKVTVGKCS